MKTPLSIYVHIPFCKSKCLYCDFVSFCGLSREDEEGYVELLKKEMELFLKEHSASMKNRFINTVFIGGGTPTALGDKAFIKLLKLMDDTFSLRDNSQVEYTVEANPKTLNDIKVAAIKKYGVNRISMGLQSSNPEELKAIGRIHCFEDAKASVELLKKSGIDNINLDLMLALPGQTIDSLQKSLEDAVSLSPAHISAYSLILEEGTALYEMKKQGLLSLPSEEEDIAMYEMAVKFLSEKGYPQYEISNFAKPYMECRHNIVYWKSMEYISFGVAAHSYYEGYRYSNCSDMKKYATSLSKGLLPVTEREFINKEMAFQEKIFLGLRMNSGISLSEIKEEFGMDFITKYDKILRRLFSEGLINYDNHTLRLTLRGFELSNYVFREILSMD